jgi:hypothetical protein
MPSSTCPTCVSDRSRGGILVDAQLPGSVQSAGQDVTIRLGQANVGSTHPAPAAGDWNEQIGRLTHELRLDLRCERQVSETVFDGSQSGENATAHPEVRRTHMRALFGAIEAQSDTTKIGSGHVAIRATAALAGFFLAVLTASRLLFSASMRLTTLGGVSTAGATISSPAILASMMRCSPSRYSVESA